MGTESHKKDAPEALKVGIITVSTSRTLKEDKSGHWIRKRAEKEGHRVVLHKVVTDDAHLIRETVLETIQQLSPDMILLSGGTGLTRSDQTIEAVSPLFSKELTAFGPVFAQLSFEEIDSAALLSRATAGIVKSTAVFCMPGSINACKLACKALIFPEAGHIVKHIRE